MKSTDASFVYVCRFIDAVQTHVIHDPAYLIPAISLADQMDNAIWFMPPLRPRWII